MRRTLLALVLPPLADGLQRLGGLYPNALESFYSRAAFPRVVAALVVISLLGG